jgi:hypothetical protein
MTFTGANTSKLMKWISYGPRARLHIFGKSSPRSTHTKVKEIRQYVQHFRVSWLYFKRLSNILTSFACTNCIKMSSEITVLAGFGPGGSPLAAPNFFHVYKRVRK